MMAMAIGYEIMAVILLIAAFVFNREVEGGAGPEKEKKVVDDIMAYFSSPGGIYIPGDRAQAVVRFAIPVFIKALVMVLNKVGLLGNSASSSKPSKP